MSLFSLYKKQPLINEGNFHFSFPSFCQERNFNVSLTDVSAEMGMLSLQGPKSRDILQALTSADLSDEAFPFSSWRHLQVAGHPVMALRVSFVGEMGWELHIPAASCVPVYKALMEAGEAHGLVNAAYRAIDSLSIEKGYPHWHQEIRMDDTPLEAGLLFTCKWKSDVPFQGKDSLLALKAASKLGGLAKKKVCLTLEDK